MKPELKKLIKEKILSEKMNLDETIEYIWNLTNDNIEVKK